MKAKTRNYIISLGSLMALIMGFVFGLLVKKLELITNPEVINWFELSGKIWVSLLILLVIPLTSAYLIVVVLSFVKTSVLGKLGARAILIHTLIFVFGMLFSVVVSFLFLEIMGENIPQLSINSVSENKIAETSSGIYSTATVLKIASKTQKFLGTLVLVFLLFSVLFAFFLGRFSKKRANSVLKIAQKISEQSMSGLQYFLLTLPLAVFVLVFPLVTKTGFTLVGVAGLNIIALSVLLLIFLLLIYLMVYFWGNISVGKFAKAMVQPQIVAASTRSSLATIPALMETAEFKMGIPKSVTAVIIPFFISVFRMNRAISSPFHYLFLSYVYGLPIDFGMLLIFLGLQVLISFGSPGIPSGGKMTNLPLYLAAGIPLEGYVLLKAVDAIPDIFKTLLNVTQVMVVSSIVAKKQNWKLN